MVYLSLAYAPYYAANATTHTDRMAIIEVDTSKLDHGKLFPDEDYIEQCLRVAPKALKEFRMENATLKKRAVFVRRNMHKWRELWQGSLEHFGNLCHKGSIPTDAITRIVAYKYQDNPAAAFMTTEPTITIQNYQFCGKQYRALTKFFIGDEVLPEMFLMPMPDQMKQEPQYLESLERMKAMMSVRKVETLFENIDLLNQCKGAEPEENRLYGIA